MSHELRTPLNSAIGFAKVLAGRTFGELNEKQGRYVNHIVTSGQHLLDLINEILDLSKVEAGKMRLDLTDVNVQRLMRDSLVMIREKACKHSLETLLDISPELNGVAITADERKLKQIMFNLLSNATKFTPDGGTIRVSARQIGTSLEVRVSDSGIGIRKGDLERIFREFEQTDSSYDRRHQGTGLGLALSRRMVELHGGRIWAESDGEGKGSSLVFTIPEEVAARNDQSVSDDCAA